MSLPLSIAIDRTVIKYRHCGRNIYSFSCSHDPLNRRQCPICLQTLTFTLLDAPVALTSPFANAHQVSCAFVIGSVHGISHLGEWHDTEMHVGLSNSEGHVYNYTLSGVQKDDLGWEQCICVQLVPPWRHDLRESWDRELKEFSVLPEWASERFNEEREFGSCCYGFALTFINHMRSVDGKACLSRDVFTGCNILPRIKTVSTYITIYHSILQHGFYMADKLDNTL